MIPIRMLLVITLLLPVLNQTVLGRPTQQPRNVLAPFTFKAIQQALPAYGSWKPFPTSAAVWQAQYPAAILQNVVKNGEEVLKKDYPYIPASVVLDFVRIGDHKLRYEKMFFEKRDMLWAATMAEAVEGKGRFIDKIVDGIWSICEETFWGTTSVLYMQKAGKGLPDVQDPVVDLYVPETAALLAWIDYFHGKTLDSISQLLRKRIHYEVERRLFTPMLTGKYFYLTADKPNNWVPWIMSNYITAQLLLESDADKRNKAIHYATGYIDKYINYGLGNDGSCDEGPGYWSQAVGCVMDALTVLHDASYGKLNVYSNPFVQKMGAYIYRMHIGGRRFINVGDAVSQITPDALFLYRYGKATGDADMVNFASWGYHTQTDTTEAPYLSNGHNSRTRKLYNMQVLPACSATPYTNRLVPDTWLADIEIMSARSANGLFVAGYGGNNGQSHNHNDVGNVLLYADGEPVVIDVGPGTYTSKTFTDQRYTLWFNTSPYHNLPTINGYGQAAGKEYTATDVQYKTDSITSTFSLNLAKTYPAAAGVQKWLRIISMNKQKGIATITDDYVLTAPAMGLTQTFMTVCNTDISTSGKIAFTYADSKKVVLDYDPASWEVKKEKIELKGTEDRTFKGSWGGKDIWRILLVSKTNVATNKVTYSFSKIL